MFRSYTRVGIVIEVVVGRSKRKSRLCGKKPMLWSTRIKKDTRECVIKIPVAQIEVIKQSLASYIGNV